jgi:hypothetical protein
MGCSSISSVSAINKFFATMTNKLADVWSFDNNSSPGNAPRAYPTQIQKVISVIRLSNKLASRIQIALKSKISFKFDGGIREFTSINHNQ